jgi:beta-lactam-binding protein with PASTA domain
MSEGSNKFFGDYGFDWITLRGWTIPLRVPGDPNRFWDIELDLLANPALALNFNDLRNFYRFVDGASGWNLDDHIAGSKNKLCDPAAEVLVVECLKPGMELKRGTAPTQVPALGPTGQQIGVNIRGGSGARKVTGLEALMGPQGFNADLDSPAIPGVKDVGFMGGDILLGGVGSDVLEGKDGDDLIDGDVWLNVQLRAVLNDGTVKLVDDPNLLVDDVFAKPSRLSPANISIVRTIVTPTAAERGPANGDCGTAAPKNCDIAVFANPRGEYSIVRNANGTLTVIDTVAAAGGHLNTGTDTLRNIELLQFSDVTVSAANAGLIGVPSLVGLTDTVALATLAAAGLTGTETLVDSTTAPIGTVLAQNPNATTFVNPGSNVVLTVSRGARVPNVTGGTQAAAAVAINAAGLIVGTVTSVANAAAAGTVIGQNPLGGNNVQPGSAVALTVSLGPANIVPNVLNQTRSAAAGLITGVGLTVGTVTFANSATVVAGSVISSNPVAGTTLAAGAPVALVVSLGSEGLVLAVGFEEATGTAAADSSAVGAVGTIREATHVAGKFGRGLSFDGINDWVTFTDTVTNGPLDLTTTATVEAWVNPAELLDWDTIVMKERGTSLSYALYANDGSPQPGGTPFPTGYIHVTNNALDREIRGTTVLPIGTWTHVAMTYDGANQRLYINGVLAATRAQTGTIAVSNNPLRIGGNNAFANEFFHGLVDEVRVYNTARSAAQILTDMNTPIVR